MGEHQAPVPGVTVVLCTRDRPEMLAGALSALLAVVRDVDEVIVVDSASERPGTQEAAAAAGVRCIRASLPGLSRARNLAIAATIGPIFAFTDDDCRPQPGWTAALASAFADPHVGIVAGRLLSETERGGQPADDPGDDAFAFGAEADVAILGATANMAFRRAALDAIGGFDEAMGAGAPLLTGEDHDAVWRVLRAGWSGRYEPSARVVHLEWRDRWAMIRRQYAYGYGAGVLAAKVRAVDPAAGWRMLGRRVGRDGVSSAARNAWRRWEGPAIGDLLYTWGVIRGAVRAWTMAQDHGLLVLPASSR